MKITSALRFAAAVAVVAPTLLPAEPVLSSWYTGGSARYARIWATQAQETAERSTGVRSSLSTWDAASYSGVRIGDQLLPVYAGIQGISYSATHVYIKSTGLATNTMGPWYLNAARTRPFPSFPGNAAIHYRFPRTVSYPAGYSPATRTATHPGACGLFVDGVPLFNTSDTFSYDTSAGADQEPNNSNRGDGYWNRDAFTNEGVTFDAGNAHQAMEAFHYHASPSALRHTLGDSVDYDSTVVYQGIGKAGPYTENFNGKHSPIIAWVKDGLPMYGPYGYSDPLNASSPVRRMTSGYQKRDGTNGSTSLAVTGRRTLPQWSVAQGQRTTTILTSAWYGPEVSAAFTLGHYMEDYDYKGDLTSDSSGQAMALYTAAASQGAFDAAKHFDLNQYNVRYAVTPEFPAGTWAYFTAVAADGIPVFPYNLAGCYFGDTGNAGRVGSVNEPVTSQFTGGEAKKDTLLTESGTGQDRTILWSGIEGGQYRLDTSADQSAWDESGKEFTAAADTFSTVAPVRPESGRPVYYRITRTGVAPYESVVRAADRIGRDDPPPHLPPSRLLMALDTDHDGMLSTAEMNAAAVSLLTLDGDRDGRLSAMECGFPPRR